MSLFKRTRGGAHPKPDVAAQRRRLNEIKARRPIAVAIAHALWAERQHNHFSESIAHIYRGES